MIQEASDREYPGLQSCIILLFLVGIFWVWSAPTFGATPEPPADDRYVTGLVLAFVDEQFVVQGALPGSPAEGAAFRKGDIIKQIDRRDASGLTWKEGLELIGGDSPGVVRFVISRGEEEIGISLERESLSAILDRKDLKTEGDRIVPKHKAAAIAVGDLAPLFANVDLLSDSKLDLIKLRGSHVVLFFWTTWCGACSQEIPRLQGLIAEKGAPTVIGVSLDEESAVLSAFLDETSFGNYQIQDNGWFGALSRAYHVYQYGVPWIVLIDAEGRIAAQGRPAEVLGDVK